MGSKEIPDPDTTGCEPCSKGGPQVPPRSQITLTAAEERPSLGTEQEAPTSTSTIQVRVTCEKSGEEVALPAVPGLV